MYREVQQVTLDAEEVHHIRRSAKAGTYGRSSDTRAILNSERCRDVSSAIRVLPKLSALTYLSLKLYLSDDRQHWHQERNRRLLPQLKGLDVHFRESHTEYLLPLPEITLAWFDLPALEDARISYTCDDLPLDDVELDMPLNAFFDLSDGRTYPGVELVELVNLILDEDSSCLRQKHILSDMFITLRAFPNVQSMHLQDCSWCWYTFENAPMSAFFDMKDKLPHLQTIRLASRTQEDPTKDFRPLSWWSVSAVVGNIKSLNFPLRGVCVLTNDVHLFGAVREDFPEAR